MHSTKRQEKGLVCTYFLNNTVRHLTQIIYANTCWLRSSYTKRITMFFNKSTQRESDVKGEENASIIIIEETYYLCETTVMLV